MEFSLKIATCFFIRFFLLSSDIIDGHQDNGYLPGIVHSENDRREVYQSRNENDKHEVHQTRNENPGKQVQVKHVFKRPLWIRVYNSERRMPEEESALQGSDTRSRVIPEERSGHLTYDTKSRVIHDWLHKDEKSDPRGPDIKSRAIHDWLHEDNTPLGSTDNARKQTDATERSMEDVVYDIENVDDVDLSLLFSIIWPWGKQVKHGVKQNSDDDVLSENGRKQLLHGEAKHLERYSNQRHYNSHYKSKSNRLHVVHDANDANGDNEHEHEDDRLIARNRLKSLPHGRYLQGARKRIDIGDRRSLPPNQGRFHSERQHSFNGDNIFPGQSQKRDLWNEIANNQRKMYEHLLREKYKDRTLLSQLIRPYETIDRPISWSSEGSRHLRESGRKHEHERDSNHEPMASGFEEYNANYGKSLQRYKATSGIEGRDGRQAARVLDPEETIKVLSRQIGDHGTGKGRGLSVYFITWAIFPMSNKLEQN